MTRRIVLAGVVTVAAVGALAVEAAAQEWPAYAADERSTKYSALDQIDRGNVHRLEIAWRFKSVDYAAAKRYRNIIVSNNFETTPLMRSGRLLLATAAGLAAALEPASGEILWSYDPYAEGDEASRATLSTIYRGGTSWRGSDPSGGEQERLIFTSNGKLVSLDTATGRPDPAFGEGGRVDLLALEDGKLRRYSWTSAPTVCRDTVILGSSTTDTSIRKREAKGVVRGYDVRSGDFLWQFSMIPGPGELGHDTWEKGSAEYTGYGNVWAWMACDEELGTIYLPGTNANNDYYGGHRLGSNLFTDSLVCLDARTGERKWHFQAVHHDLWDYDFPASPILADIQVSGRQIKAVAQVSKQAFLYVFDRITGEPVWPIVELPVPPSDVPGERAWPTQPHPTWPRPYDLQGLAISDLIDFTPELRAEAMEVVSRYSIGPLFSPPVVRGEGGLLGHISAPSVIGGSNWTGAAYDPETHVIYIPSVTHLYGEGLKVPGRDRSDLDYTIEIEGSGELVEMLTPSGLPITKPPWGRITAIDLDSGEHLWMAANGEGPRKHQKLRHLDLPALGSPSRVSPLVTKTLLFLAEGSPDMIGVPDWAGGRGLRVYDKATGEVIFRFELPAGATGAPMTYLYEGRQYIVLPVGEKQHEGELIALRLAP